MFALIFLIYSYWVKLIMYYKKVLFLMLLFKLMCTGLGPLI